MARDTYDSGLLDPGGPDPAADMLRRNEGLILAPKRDVNHQRVGYGSDTTTDASGRVSEVTPATRITPADANRDLKRREYETQAGIIDKIGPDAWFRLTPEAQAALTDIAYNYGSLDKLPSVIKAAQTGDPVHLADTLASRSADNSGVNQRRRLEEAYAVMAGGEGDSDQAQPRQAQQKRKSFSWDEIPAEIQSGVQSAQQPQVGAAKAKRKGFSWDEIPAEVQSGAPPGESQTSVKAEPEMKLTGHDWSWLTGLKALTETKPSGGQPAPGDLSHYPKDMPLAEKVKQELARIDSDPELKGIVKQKVEEGVLAGPLMRMLGIASGVGQAVTGPLAALPNVAGGGAAAEAHKALGNIGSKEMQTVGELGALTAIP